MVLPNIAILQVSQVRDADGVRLLYAETWHPSQSVFLPLVASLTLLVSVIS